MNHGKIIHIALIAALGVFLAGCKATQGFFAGARQDVQDVTNTASGLRGAFEGAFNYDPTNGTVSESPLGPAKVYYPAPQTEK